MVLKMAHFRKSTGPRWVKDFVDFQPPPQKKVQTVIFFTKYELQHTVISTVFLHFH